LAFFFLGPSLFFFCCADEYPLSGVTARLRFPLLGQVTFFLSDPLTEEELACAFCVICAGLT
jgi:hypothetical protein